jgi:hypothetical protein
MRAWDAMRCCFGVQSRQIGIGDIELDFGHLLAGKACRLGPAGRCYACYALLRLP